MLLNTKIPVWDFIRRIKFDLLAIISFSIFLGFISKQHYFTNIEVPIALVAIIGTSISLLLAFRTAQSYDRWWEARIVWGAIVNDSRTLVRQLQEFLPDSEEKVLEEFTERQIIWNYTLADSLRKVPFSLRVENYLKNHNITDFNAPNGLLVRHGLQLKKLAHQGKISEFRQVQIDETLVRLCESMGRCERIKNTIFPAAYGWLIHFIIYIFTMLLPFALDYNLGIIKAMITAGVPMIFVAIERTAILMQDPFENTPLDTPMITLSRTIEANLLQQIGKEAKRPTPVPSDTYFVM